MRALAPGKLVLSGAYAVLRGAPALVAAVDRYVLADTERPPEFLAPEVECALREHPGARAPWFDASALRDERGKLGLGSSAAILVASLAALEGQRLMSLPLHERAALELTLPARLFPQALVAHQTAQGGGSGVDVAAAVYGGTLLARRGPDGLSTAGCSLPTTLSFEVWVMGRPASTAELIQQVFSLAQRAPETFEQRLGAQAQAAEEAALAARAGDAAGLLGALTAQHDALVALGDASGAPIVVDAVRALHRLAQPGGVVLPSGAGGGDVSLYVGPAPSPASFRAEAARQGLFLLDVHLGARGVHLT